MINSDKLNILNSVFPDTQHQPIKNVFSFLENSLHDFNQKEQEEDWSNLPGSYGTYCGLPNSLDIPNITEPWQTIYPVLHANNFIGCDYDNSFKIAEGILNKRAINNNKYTLFSNSGKLEFLQIYEIGTGTFIQNVVNGILYTVKSLEIGIPVIFGVNCQNYPSENNSDESTNHHIIIVGMGNDGQNYFLGWDLACLFSNYNNPSEFNVQDAISVTNKIYLDKNWPGLLQARNTWSNFYACNRQPYKVTQIFKTFNLE